MRTLSAPIHFSNSTGVFGNPAFLIRWDQDMAGGFLEEKHITFTAKIIE